MDKIKTIAHLADIHIRKLHRMTEYRDVFNRLYAKLEKLKPDLIYIGGDVVHGKLDTSPEEIRLVSDVANELKNDLRQDVRRVESIVNDVEQQVKEDSRDNAKDLKATINTLEEDMKKLEERIKQAQKELEEKIDKRIKRALENPLGG